MLAVIRFAALYRRDAIKLFQQYHQCELVLKGEWR